jgi:DNA-binding Lrp family transcriptional regulator
VDPEAVGLGFEAIVFITMRQEDRETLMAFEEGVAAIPQVLQAERLFGEPDYLLRIMTSDLAAYQRLQDDKLAVLPGVQRMTSTLVMKRIAHDRPDPPSASATADAGRGLRVGPVWGRGMGAIAG